MSRTEAGGAQLALIGGYPPPWGGITVHLQRLGGLLDANGIEWRLYNVSSASGAGTGRVVPVHRSRRSWLVRYALTAPEPVIHIHGMESVAARMVVLPLNGFKRRRVVISYHNARIIDAFPTLPAVTRAALRAQWRHCSRIHVVSRPLAEFLEAHGVEPHRIVEYPAFLPPVRGSGPPLAANLRTFMAGPSATVLAIGSEATDDGQSTYGLDLLVPMLHAVRSQVPGVRLLVVAHSGATGTGALFRKLREDAHAVGLSDDVRIVPAQGDLAALMECASVYVRPSRTDGDAVAVREALHLGVPVVASDAAARPEGTSVFPLNDLEGFASQVVTVLKDRERGRPRAIPAQDFGGEAVKMYRELLAGSGE